MDPDATVMIHDVSSGMYGKVEELEADVEEAKRLNKKIYKNYKVIGNHMKK